MAAVIFIGDELTATGFRLTGIETVMVDETMALGPVFDAARQRAGLVILTAAAAGRIAPEQLDSALLAEVPIVAVVPDILQQTQPPDVARRLRTALGIEQ